jgi:hypothetical protein
MGCLLSGCFILLKMQLKVNIKLAQVVIIQKKHTHGYIYIYTPIIIFPCFIINDLLEFGSWNTI